MSYSIIERKTKIKFTEEKLALLLYKEGNDIVYCDLEGIAKIEAKHSKTGNDEYYLIDECGHQVWIDTERFELKEN